MRNISVNYFEFGPFEIWNLSQEAMSFKERSYLQLWLPFHSAEGNHLCNSSKE